MKSAGFVSLYDIISWYYNTCRDQFWFSMNINIENYFVIPSIIFRATINVKPFSRLWPAIKGGAIIYWCCLNMLKILLAISPVWLVLFLVENDFATCQKSFSWSRCALTLFMALIKKRAMIYGCSLQHSTP